MIEHYCDFTSYLFYENASQAYNTSLVKVVSILEVFHRKMEVRGIIPLSQDLIAEIAGISKIQVARAYKELKEEGIIEIMRNGIVILNENKLIYS